MNQFGQLEVGDYIERRWCPYCFVLDTYKTARGRTSQFIRRMNGGRGKPSHVTFPTTRAYRAHMRRMHPQSFTQEVLDR